ncbi:MAG TPA: DUF445 domain-containing protein [Burkholderiaceae bacterium]
MEARDRAQATALRQARRWALALLLLALAALLAAHALLPPGLWRDGIRAVAEAALVGGLADWFAVVALFRRPLGLPIPHTAVIPRNKERIGENLAAFVRDRFLDPGSLVALLRRNDLAGRLARWLAAPGSAALLGRQVSRLASAALDAVQDAPVEHFIRKAVRALVAQLDLSRGLATVLDALTHNGRHQELLDAALARLVETLQNPQTRALIANAIVHWVKTEHPLKEKVLPTEWLGDKGSALIAHALESLLAEVAANPGHLLRAQFDQAVQRFIERLRDDPDFARRGEQLRGYLLTDAALARYVQDLWQGLRASLRRDLSDPHSALARNARAMGRWLGRALAQDAALREALNTRLEHWARGLAPEVSQFVARHIADTVRQWDAQELARLVELNIGADLQYIRINGTVVGALVGLALFALSHADAWVAALRGP